MRSPFITLLVLTLFVSSALAFLPISPVTAQSGATTDPVPISLNFDNGIVGDLTPANLKSDPVEQTQITGAKYVPYVLGPWVTNELTMPISIYGAFYCELYVSSQDSAKNARFEVFIYRDTTEIARYNSSSLDLSPDVTKFNITGQLTADFQAGEQLSVSISFYSDLIATGSIPPWKSATSTFFYGGGEYLSRISVVTLPIVVELIEPEIEKNAEFIGFRALVKEAFDIPLGDLNMSMTITPPAGGPEEMTFTEAEATKTEDGIIFAVDWEFLKDKKVKDGDYTITMEASYDGVLMFSNTTAFTLDLPEKKVTDLNETPIDPVIVAGAVAGLLIVGLAVYLNRRKKFRRKASRSKGKGKRPSSKGKKRSRPKKKREEVEEVEELDEDEEDED